jgi:hypothetical protein
LNLEYFSETEEQIGVGVFENRVLRRIFGPKSDEVAEKII